MQVTLATVERQLLDLPCRSVSLPTVDGQIEVLPGHATLLTQLSTGLLWAQPSDLGSAATVAVVQEGFAQVIDGHLRVISEHVELAEEIDLVAAQAALVEVTDRISKGGLNPDQIAVEQKQRRLLQARIQTKA